MRGGFAPHPAHPIPDAPRAPTAPSLVRVPNLRIESLMSAPSDIQTSGYAVSVLPSDTEMCRAAEFFKVLSHPDRLRLACFLRDGRVTTQHELIDEFGWPQSTAARHIAALRRTGLIEATRHGPEVHLRLGADVGLRLMGTVCTWLHAEAG